MSFGISTVSLHKLLLVIRIFSLSEWAQNIRCSDNRGWTVYHFLFHILGHIHTCTHMLHSLCLDM